jgi:hypothetical protein
LTQYMLTNPKARTRFTRATLGIGLALAAVGAVGLGSGVARAVPQQPLLIDDPLPVPTPAGPNPASAVNIANAIFTELDNLLSTVFPGSSSVLMPADTGASPLSPGLGNSGLVPPGQATGLPGYPGTAPSTYPGAMPPGYPTSVPQGQAPPLPAQPGPVAPGENVPIV